MSPQIPSLSSGAVKLFTACAHLVPGVAVDQVPPDGLSGEFDLLVGDVSHRLYFNLDKISFDDEENEHVHFHFQLGLSDFVGSLDSENARGSIDDLAAAFAIIKGSDAFIFVSGECEIGVEDIPTDGFIRKLTGISTSFDDVNLAIKGVEFSLEGSPVKSMRWSITKDRLRIKSELHLPTELSDDYLHVTVRQLEMSVRRFILEVEDETI